MGLFAQRLTCAGSASKRLKLRISTLVKPPCVAMAASPEQAYLAARDAQIRRLTALSNPNPSADRVLKETIAYARRRAAEVARHRPSRTVQCIPF